MNDIKVSIIVPCYNVEVYLEECLESLANQTLEEIEIIVVDNNSTDGTQAIIGEYAVRYPEKIISLHQPIQGLSAARNKGLEVIRGQYVGFVDSDDFVELDMYERLYEAGEEYNSDLVVCGWNALYENGSKKETYQTKIDVCANIFKEPNYLLDTNVFVWNKLYRSDLLKRYNIIFDTNLYYCEDGMFNGVYSYFANNIIHLREPLYFYRARRLGSATATFNENILSQIDFCEKITLFYKRVGYFDFFKTKLLWIIVGYFRRKLYDAVVTKRRLLAMQFISSYFVALEKYYPHDWRHFVRRYGSRGRKFKYIANYYKTNKRLLALRIYTPNWILRVLYHVLKAPFRLMRKLVHLKRRTKAYFTTKRRNFRYLKNVVGKYLELRETSPIVDKQILLSPHSGMNASGSMYYLLEDAIKRGKYVVYMISDNPGRDEPLFKDKSKKIKIIRPNSPEAVCALATSKYLATDTRLPDYFIKREDQVLLNTWHGTPLKHLGFDVPGAFSDIGGIENQFISSDYLLYPNEHTKDKMMNAYCLNYLFSNNAILSGYPRNAAFYNDATRNELKTTLGLQGKRIYVYMPTWRGTTWANRKNKKYQDVTTQFLKTLDESVDDDVVIFYRAHNYTSAGIRAPRMSYSNIRPFPNNVETYALLNIADCLISDYSSVIFDFACTGKDIILFAFDEEEYYETRGMYFSLDELPFTKVDNIDALVQHVNDKTDFIKREAYSHFQEKFCAYDSAFAAKNLNDVFLDGKKVEHGEIIDYSEKRAKKYNVYFVPKDIEEHQKDDLLPIIFKDPDSLVVVGEGKFSCHTDEMISKVLANGLPCLIARMNKSIGFAETLKMRCYTKFGIFKKTAKMVCIREQERLMPGINVSKYTNLSSDDIFIAMTHFLQK